MRYKNVADDACSDYIRDMISTISKSGGAGIAQGLLLALAIPVMLAAVGCRSPQQRIERYLGDNKDRPEPVQQALREGRRIVPGMTEQEVRLVLGPPARSETHTAGTATTWHYDRPRHHDNTLQTSDMWALPVPLSTVVFGPDNTVAEIISYDRDRTANLPEPATPAATIRPLTAQPLPATATAAAMPDYQPGPDEVNVQGWPEITLQGLTGSGNARNAAINGLVREPGDLVGEVRLNAVYANGVILEYRGRRAFLRPGESTGSRDGTR